MTTAPLLPHGIRDVSRADLLALEPDARIERITTALAAFYAARIDSDEDDDWDGQVDVSHPLIFESVVAAEMNLVMQRWLGVTVPIETLLLDGISLRRLAELLATELDASVPSAAGPALVPDPADRHLPFALSDIQQAYWIGRDPVFDLGSVSASLFVELGVTGFDVARAEVALQQVVDSHDMLRSIVDRSGHQRVLSDVPPIRITETDLGSSDPQTRAAALAAERMRLSQRDTRPDLWAPFEVVALHVGEGRTFLMISVDMVKLDAWSVQLLLAEWFLRYDDPDVVIRRPEVTFRDYARWTEQVRGSASYLDDRRYWLDRLPTMPPAPELPLRIPLEDIEHPTFRSRGTRLRPADWQRLKDRAAEEGLTPSMLLCAAYAEVLGTWSRNRRFTLSVAGGRPAEHSDLARVLGPFARPTLLEVDASAAGFRDRARTLQRQFSRDLEHREFGGLDVLREIAARDGRTRATIPVIFTSVLPQAGEGGLPHPDWLVAEPYVVWGMPQLLLENQMLEVDGALLLTWVAAEEAFPDGLVDDMFSAYLELLRSLADKEDLWSGGEPHLVPAAQVAVRARVNDTAAPQQEGLLHDPFAAQVARRPEAPAIISSRRRLDYADLDRQAGHVAAAVAAREPGRNSLVGVCMERGWEQVAAVLGVLRAGAAYLPLDPDLPARRLSELIIRGECGMVLTQPWLDGLLHRSSSVETVAVEHRAERPAAVPPIRVQPSDLAYVIFTSGSTGTPKGVMVEHRAALNTVLDINDRFEIGSADRLLGVSSLSFDLSVHDVFGALAAGAALVLPDPAPVPEPEHWSELLDTEGVTVWNSVPALMQLLVDHRRRVPLTSSGLRLALLSGDWIPVGMPGDMAQVLPGVRVVSLGGATEAAIWSVFHPVTVADARRPSIPYGRPLTNQHLHVLDDRMAPRPDHVPGDLYIGGAGLARGYWRDPDRTASKFARHPSTGDRLYATGDIARYLPGGDLEFLGREDSQVKVNGYRVELGEIESVLRAHPAIRSAAASVRGPRAGGRSLAAYVMTDGSTSIAELRAFLADRLPRHAVPDRIVEIDRIPLTRNGKVNRAALDAVVMEPRPSTSARRARTTGLEEALLALVNELLVVESAVDDDFFAIGGNSLIAVQLAARAQDQGIPLTAADVMQNPSVTALAATLDTAPESL